MAKTGWVKTYQPLFIPLSIFLGGLTVAIAIITTGGLGRVTSSADDTGNVVMEVEVSVDDDPFLGDPNAPVTVVEFLSFECPWCKKFHDETFPQLESQYIDTGKIKFVVRDLPLSFQDPAATKDAWAADCARDQGGDQAYFGYLDEIFARTGTEGVGLPKEGKISGYDAAAKKLGLDLTKFRSCLASAQFKDEVAKDLADVTALGQKLAEKYPEKKYPGLFRGIGTPTFFIGKTDSSGTFTGQVLGGAYPFDSFQQTIDQLLK
jgi:protein-disulfide isomerase